MPRLIVFQHVAFELLGTLNPLLKRYGFRIRYVNFGRFPDARPSLEGYDGLIVLGGPMSVNAIDEHPHLATEVELIREAVANGTTVLGICLGAQLLARALGAAVRRNPSKEIGWFDVSLTGAGREDPLLRDFAGTEKIFQWHGDTFEIPEGAVHLASSEACTNQAFRYGERAYGLQFHLEVDEPLIERWLTVPVHREELASLQGQVSPDVIRAETRRYMPRNRQLGARTFEAFIELFGPLRRRERHPHRQRG